ncbi:MAG: hypothetical protein RLO18_27500, partial [Gimesia chilikensis]
MMSLQRTVLFLMLTVTLSFQLNFHPVSAGAAEPKLAGARPVIHAINYSTIQEAIDAVPAEGGIVMLPPGKFEIDKPLVITSGDFMLVGAVGATHIHNKNEEGLDAIQIHPPADMKLPDGKKDPKPRIWRVQLQNFRVTGNEKSGRG